MFDSWPRYSLYSKLVILLSKLAQKSFPILNKVNTSMVWYTTFYYKHYKWLSSQYLYLLVFLNKIFVVLDFFFYSFMWIQPYTVYLTKVKHEPVFYKLSRVKFFKPVTAYLVSFGSSAILFNIYYKTSLEQLQSLLSNKTEERVWGAERGDGVIIESLFFC